MKKEQNPHIIFEKYYDQKSDYFTECNHKYCIDCLKRLTKCAMCNKILNRSLICQEIRNKFHNENRSDMSDIYIIYYSFITSNDSLTNWFNSIFN